MTKIQQYLQTINNYRDSKDQLFQIYYLAGLLETAQIMHDPERKIIDSHTIDNPQMRHFLLNNLMSKLNVV